MDFTELLRRKIEERRQGRSAAVQAAAEADVRFRGRTAALATAISAMIASLSKDPMFANAMGRPEVNVRRADKAGLEGAVTFQGRLGSISFNVLEDDAVWLRIYPDWSVAAALDCGTAYEADPIIGELSRIDDLLLRACDHLGDYLADIYLSPAAHLLEPEPRRSTDLDE